MGGFFPNAAHARKARHARGRGRRAATDAVCSLFYVSFLIFGLLQGIAFALDAFAYSFRHEVAVQLRAVKVDRNKDSRVETLPDPH